MSSKICVIIGAGPAGLTSGHELIQTCDVQPLLFESTDKIGGISQTVDYKGNKIDIGGHRFFSKNERVMQFWRDCFKFQDNQNSNLNINDYDNVMLLRNRMSRIYFNRTFYDYPISFKVETINQLGYLCCIAIALSYLKAKVIPIGNERSLEDFLVNRFGRTLYKMFFKDYTQKVWGVTCAQIGAEWGRQRIKGLSIRKVVAQAVRDILLRKNGQNQEGYETSLIKQFLYPKYGPGQLWEKIADSVELGGGKIIKRHGVVGLNHENNRITSVIVKDMVNGKKDEYECDYVLSSMPVTNLIYALGDNVPAEVIEVANGLKYRDFMVVGLLLDKLKLRDKSNGQLIPDQWIYVQEKSVKLGRLQIFNNWSPYMVKNKGTVWLGLEYFCNEGDNLWEMSDCEFIDYAIQELISIGFIDRNNVLDATRIKMPKAYPAYFGTFPLFSVIRDYVDQYNNLFLIGRNGMHRYNNMDHSMLSAMIAVDNIFKGRTDKSNIWTINTDVSYCEE